MQASATATTRALCASSTTWLATAHVPHLLHDAGAHVTFLGPHGAWPLKGRFVDRHVAAEGSPAEVARALGDHLATGESYDWVIIGDDPLLAALATLRAEPWVPGVLPIEPDAVRHGLLGTKVGFVRACGALGLPSPWSRVCRGKPAIEAAVRELGRPALIKEDGFSGGEGCHRVATVRDVRALPDAIGTAEVVVQEFVTGQMHSLEALYDRGHLRALLTSRVVRAWPAPYGPSAVRRFEHDDALVTFAEQIGRVVGVHGFGNITVIRGDDGRLVLIELDPRPNAVFHLGDALGVPMSDALRAILARAPIAPPAHLARGTDVEVPLFPGDVLRCVLEGDLGGLAAWTLNLDGRWRFLPQDDPKLLAAYRVHIVRALARHLLPSPVRTLAMQVPRTLGRLREATAQLRRASVDSKIRSALTRTNPS